MKTRYVVICFFSFILLTTSAFFYYLPILIKEKIPTFIKEKVQIQLAFEQIKIDLFSGHIVVLDLKLGEINQSPLLNLTKFDLNIAISESIQKKALIIESVYFEKPLFHLIQDKSGNLNIANLIPHSEKKESQQTHNFPFLIKKMELNQGKILFEREKIKYSLESIDLKLNQLNSFKTQPAQFSLFFNFEDGKFLSEGNLNLKPLNSDGKISFNNFSLEKLNPILSNLDWNFQGKENLMFNYRIDSANVLDISIEKGQFSIENLKIKQKNTHQQLQITHFKTNGFVWNSNEKNVAVSNIELNDVVYTNESVLKIQQLLLEKIRFSIENEKLNLETTTIKNTQIFEKGINTALIQLPFLSVKNTNYLNKSNALNIQLITSNDAHFHAWLSSNGEINYQRLIPKSEETPSKKPFNLKISTLNFKNFNALFEDRTLSKPLEITLNKIDISLLNLTNEKEGKSLFQFATKLNNNGIINLKGDLTLLPFSLHSSVNIQTLNLEKFQSYADKFIHLDIIHGDLMIDGTLDITDNSQNELNVKFKGNTGISKLLTRDQLSNRDFLKWDNFLLKNINADVNANRYDIGALFLDKPYLRFIIKKDKTFNFDDIFISSIQYKNAKNSSRAEIEFNLDKIKITDGSSYFADLSLILPFTAEIKGLEGGVNGISSQKNATIDLNLKGNAYDLSPVDIKGKISPYLDKYDASLNFHELPMPLVSPYIAEFSGFKVEKGKMSLGMQYQIEQGELTASNNLLIDQFELGERIENPNAADVPLDLAIALLKDLDGRIKIDVPVTGNLNNPEFSVGAIITDALINSLTKVITSPFQAIAALVDSEEDLSVVHFSAGSALLNDEEKRKLTDLAKVLKDRPELKIEIKGTAFTKEDWAILKYAALFDNFKKIQADLLNQKNKRKIRAEYVELSDEDYRNLLTQEFKSKYPQKVKKSFFDLGEPQLVDSENGDFYEVAKNTLANALEQDAKRLRNLAVERSKSIAKYLVQENQITNEHVFILDPITDPERENNEISSALFLKIE